jgi:predicted ATPase
LVRELSQASTTSVALVFAAWFNQIRGEKETLQERIDEGMALATAQGFLTGRAQATFLQGWLLVEQGNDESGIAQMLKSFITEQDKALWARWKTRQAALLANAYRKTGQTVEGLKLLDEAIATATQTGFCYYEAELHRIKGELLLAQTPADEQQAEACFHNALNVARRQSAKSLELRAAMSLSRLWQRQGQHAAARQVLGEIYGWFTEGFDTADLKEAKALLEELS